MLVLALVVWQALRLPAVEDPIPDRIGLGDLVSLAGTGGVVAGVAFIAASPPKRDKAIRWGALIGFGFGVGLYLVSLVAQLISGI
jgi:hypothetical protein